MPRHQEGYIWRKGESWYGRWREDTLEGGKVVRRQRARKLTEYCERYRLESDVRPLLDEILRPLNAGRTTAASTLSVAEFVKLFYLSYAKGNCKPSTYSAYLTQWNMYLSPRLKKIPCAIFVQPMPPDCLRIFSKRMGWPVAPCGISNRS